MFPSPLPEKVASTLKNSTRASPTSPHLLVLLQSNLNETDFFLKVSSRIPSRRTGRSIELDRPNLDGRLNRRSHSITRERRKATSKQVRYRWRVALTSLEDAFNQCCKRDLFKITTRKSFMRQAHMSPSQGSLACLPPCAGSELHDGPGERWRLDLR